MRPLTNSNEIKDRHCPLPNPVPSREPALFPPYLTLDVAPTPQTIRPTAPPIQFRILCQQACLGSRTTLTHPYRHHTATNPTSSPRGPHSSARGDFIAAASSSSSLSRAACRVSPRPDPAPYPIPRMNRPQSWLISSSISISSISIFVTEELVVIPARRLSSPRHTPPRLTVSRFLPLSEALKRLAARCVSFYQISTTPNQIVFICLSVLTRLSHVSKHLCAPHFVDSTRL